MAGSKLAMQQIPKLTPKGGINTYAYVRGNPLNYIDPKGLYGTKSCTYYDQACSANEGTYECKVAKILCPTIPGQ